MYTLEKGKPYPYHNKADGNEKMNLETNEAFFDILFYSSQAKEDSKFWGKAPVKIYPVFIDHIPSIIVKFLVQKLEFDVTMNFHKVEESARDEWLNQNVNAMTIFLIDANTNIIRGMRMIGTDFQDPFRQACRNQLDTYGSFVAVDAKITEI